MERRTFISGVAGFLCLPFPVLRRKCPYRIEEVTEHLNRFLDGDEVVGIYNHTNRTFITAFYKPIVEKNLKQIMPGVPMRIKCWTPWGVGKPGIIYIKMSQDFTPEQAAWKLFEIRQILDA